MGLFRTSRELHFGIYNQVPLHGKGRRMLYRVEKEVGRTIVNKVSKAFQWLSTCQGRTGLSSSCWALLSLQGVRTPPSGLPALLIEVSVFKFFTFPPFWSRSFSESIPDQESGFLVSVAFCPAIPGKIFPGCSVSHCTESVRIGNLLRSRLSNEEWEGELSGTFYVKSICYQDHKHWRSSECYVIIKGLVTNFRQAWPGYLEKAVSSDVICSNSGKSLLSGHQMICRSSQGLELSLSVPHESKSLFLGVLRHKGWSAVPDRGLSTEVKGSSFGSIFSNRQNLQVSQYST